MLAGGRAPLAPAPVGHDATPAREQLADVQRARIVAAMTSVVAEEGLRNATIARIVARAGVSRRTFYEYFDDREDCFIAAFEQAIERLSRAVLPAYDRAGAWHERIRAALEALLHTLTYERGAGQLVIVEPLGAGHRALACRRRVLAQIITAIDAGGCGSRRGQAPPPLTAEGLAGGAFALIHARILAPQEGQLIELANPLMAMIVLPYRGPAAARRELAHPLPAHQPPTVASARDPLRDLNMRLTYRTLRVLLAIGADPGASNRGIGEAAGIRDQGQVSKLLARLEQLGLTRNAADPHLRGGANAWTLTERGQALRATAQSG